MFHQVLTQWMPPSLISTRLCPVPLQSVKAASGALNVTYMTDCFPWSEMQRTKRWRNGEGENKMEEKGTIPPSPPGRFPLQQQHLEAQFRPEFCLPLTLQSVQSHCEAPITGCAPQVLLKSVLWDVFVGVTISIPYIFSQTEVQWRPLSYSFIGNFSFIFSSAKQLFAIRIICAGSVCYSIVDTAWSFLSDWEKYVRKWCVV